ncbi:TetR/AcrR family transcriptional regulator [Geothrix edaphica]|uniref:TetR family transcriptional regulator n=1 Tax=Geothrix edaphica TaxID=2927976 RepID=A0ABQ5PZ16_9BACT|nr:TetR/AcrR family transcriptional regulator [Geothrix edaphica]GLH67632.1 TetR family transcriptional regulator [Geothrix edaphica]
MPAPSKKPRRPTTPLSPEVWVKAAQALIIREGVSAVAVEPLAQVLGVTKGSFYWHFDSRDALIRAALVDWEQDQSADVVTRYGGITDPRRRLRVLLFAAFEDVENGLFFAALAVSGEDPRVAPFLRRATERRLAFGAEAFLALGLTETEARQRALLAYAAYAGYFQLLRTTPKAVKAVTDLSGYVRQLADALVPPGPSGKA